MPVVECPKCKRRLHLPESAIGAEARCPVCQAVFPALPEGGLARPISEPLSVPDPTAPWRPGGRVPEPQRAPAGPRPPHQDIPPEREGDRAALDTAGAWLFGLSLTGLIWNMVCGCGGVIGALERADVDEGVHIIFLSGHFGHVVSLIVVLVAANAMRQARASGLCWTGAVLAIAEAFFVLYAFAVLMVHSSKDNGNEFTFLLVGISLLLSVGVLIAGVCAAGVLSRPGVKELLARNRPKREDD